MHIRDATSADAGACAAIYAPFVTGTAVSFESEPPDAAQMAGRIATARRHHAWRVGTDPDGTVLGYAYGAPFKPREAYRWTCEVSVYLHPDARGRGAGRALYTDLLDRLAERGMVVAVAVLTLPNDASVGLHRSLGFTEVGVFPGVGWKLGRWRDVVWYRRALADPPPEGPVLA
ncbi:GNAT family N-acetyltransferase [Pseudonocardia sp. HH130630-07]|uniref:GNAT family N-acetyltransferase n=1 Tax=Pseudonocardia sp. HH130630-07 TaxID=1690815 RepID=UPI000815215A|nr:GNAT family N-acetyltransferase [Pseudonocardia sp. HH130630-07]ANY05262.1 GCN5 family acetyltransferase [Pseudonocardia sp. HH130630-07]